MKITNKLKAASLELRKKRDPLAGRIALVLADITARAKEIGLKSGDYSETDDLTIPAIRKAIKSAQDAIDINPDDKDSIEEVLFLKYFLPEPISEEVIKNEVRSFLEGKEVNIKLMGSVMGHLSKKFGAELDKGIASTLVKNILT